MNDTRTIERKGETMTTLNTATDILFHLGRNAARNDEVEGMMRHTGTDTLGACIRKLRDIRPEVREDVIIGLWALRYSAGVGDTHSDARWAARQTERAGK